MKLTAEISLYPLTPDFKSIIKDFISQLQDEDGLTVQFNNVSTQISGDYDLVFEVLKNRIKPVYEKEKSVFVVKFLEGDKLND